MDELRILIANSHPDCIAVTETWLTSSTPDDFLAISGFSLFRCDRSGRSGGGVCIYMRDDFKPYMTTQMSLGDSPVESLSIALHQPNVIILCLYIPPNLCSSYHKAIADSLILHIDNLLITYPEAKFIICGDFNDFPTTTFHRDFLCVNRVIHPTRGHSLLDHIWISEVMEENYPNVAVIGPPLGTSDHNTVLLRPTHTMQQARSTSKIVFDFRKSHISTFLHCLSSSNFEPVYSATDVNEKCEAFNNILFDAMSVIPQCLVSFTKRDKPWITPVLKKLIQDRWTAYRTKNWPLFNHLKTKVKSEILRAKKTWSERILHRDKNVWNIVRDLKGKKRQSLFPCDKGELSSFLDNLTQIFQSYSNEEADADLQLLVNDDCWSIQIEAASTYELLTKLKVKQSPGYDGIPARLLKEGAYFLCEPLSDIFRTSILTRQFPDSWKCGFICPIPKKNNPTVNDFRPISLLPIVSKLFEKVVLSCMKTAFIENFGNSQHAFCPHGSTTSALIDIHDTVTSFLERPNTTGVRITCLDFSKAFNKLQHHRLINYLSQNSFNHGFLLWLLSFLTKRSERVRINDHVGPLITVKSGVPQGSVLGPYLFALFIASLQINRPDVKLVKYADDLTLIECCTNTNSNQTSLDIITSWSKTNKMQLNLGKCQQMVIRRSRSHPIATYDYIEVSPVINILGVTIGENLNWNPHFDRVLLSANRRLYIIRSLKPLVSKEKLLEVFLGSVLAVIMYASPVFGILPAKIKHNINKFMRKAHRIICDPSCNCTVLPDVHEMRENLARNLFLKCTLSVHPLHALVPSKMPHSQRFRMPLCSTSRRLNSFFPSTCLLLNIPHPSM